ncbi:hypothetical protein BDV06DRAFT_228004 [Aspergillus oleicola]
MAALAAFYTTNILVTNNPSWKTPNPRSGDTPKVATIPDFNNAHATWHELALLAKTLLAPELIAVEGLQEWAQCRRIIKDCENPTYGEFKPVHAYYISMLALRYESPDGNSERDEDIFED